MICQLSAFQPALAEGDMIAQKSGPEEVSSGTPSRELDGDCGMYLALKSLKISRPQPPSSHERNQLLSSCQYHCILCVIKKDRELAFSVTQQHLNNFIFF